jgi:hypothetical protein
MESVERGPKIISARSVGDRVKPGWVNDDRQPNETGVPAEYSVPAVAVAVAGQRLIPSSSRMTALFIAVLASLRATVRSRLELAAEILALRHQLAVLHRTSPKRPYLRPIDRLLWMLLSTLWPNWRQAVQIVMPATVVGWHRHAFAAYWRWHSRPGRVGLPAVADVRSWPMGADVMLDPS